MVYAFGAYGTNNIGDEAIFMGLKSEYPNAIQLYVNKPSSWITGWVLPEQAPVWYADFLTGIRKFTQEDTLIIGGGGLLHSYQAVKDYCTMAQLVVHAGGKVLIEGIGAEGLQSGFADIVRELLALAEHISVRTTTSKTILQPLTNKKIDVRKDFAYSMALPHSSPPGPLSTQKYIGIVVGGADDLHVYDELSQLLAKYTVGTEHYNFLLLPHSISYTNPMNNDLLIFQYLWSNCDIYHAKREERIYILDYAPRYPEETLNLYKELMIGCIGWRYHSLIFSEMANVPMLLAAPTFKNMAYVKDVTRSNLIVKENNETLEQAFNNFIPLLAVQQF
jgi:polysaccharide pyruvyl transferase WcaK-like protein